MWSYFMRRCWFEGRSKAAVRARVGGKALSSERDYVTTTLRAGLAREIRTGLGGEVSALHRALGIVAGLGITTGGYLNGRIRAKDPRRHLTRRPRLEASGPWVSSP